MTTPSAFLDTCVLYSAYLRDTLLSIAASAVYRPLWSCDVVDELSRNLIRSGVPEHAVGRLIEQMRRAFEDSEVLEYHTLVDSMSCHPKDRHVLAAAVRGASRR